MVFAEPCPGTYGAPPLVVQAPALLPWRFGLASVANFIDETDDHARNGIFYKSPLCTADVRPWVDDCDSDEVALKSPTDVPAGEEDPFEPYVAGCPLHLYAALSCKQTNLAAMSEEVREVFEADEQRALEAAVWEQLLANGVPVVLNASDAPEDAFCFVGGVAALESAIASVYGGRATLHADRGVGAFAARDRQVHTEGATKYTELGNAFAFYGGSPNTGPDGDPAPDGYAWIYATSTVTIRRFPLDVLPNDVNQRLQYDPLTNEPYVLAERTYVPSIECPSFAALVELNC